jgi:predicted MFS family arabinose efflux permease
VTQTLTAGQEWRKYGILPVVAMLGYSASSLHTYGLGAFVEPLQDEFGWSRALISMGLTIAGLTAAVMAIPIGLLVDRIGPRIIGLCGVAAMTGAWALMGTATGSVTNWIVLWSIVAVANLGLQGTVWTKAVGSRFTKSRGMAFAVTLSGAPITATVLPPLATALIAAFDWRAAFMGVGLVWFLVVFPPMLLFFRSPHDRSRRKRADTQEPESAPLQTGVTFSEALRTPAFYKLIFATALFAFTVIGLIVHFVPILTDQGATRMGAAGVAALVGIFSIIGRFGTGFLLDRFPSNIVGAVVFTFPVFSCTLLMVDGANPVSQALAAVLFGLTVGAEVDVIAYLSSHRFGLKSYGSIFGAMMAALSIGVALGPLAAGAFYDAFGSYTQFLWVTMAAMLASGVAILTVGRTVPGEGH